MTAPPDGAPSYHDMQNDWQTLQSSGRAEHAYLVAHRASRLFPTEPLGPLGKCWYHLASSQPEALLRAAREAATLFPGAFDPHFFECTALEGLQDPEELEKAYKSATVAHPGRKLGWLGVARLLANRGDLTAALAHLIEAMVHVFPEEREAVILDYLSIRTRVRGAPREAERDRLIEASRHVPKAAGDVIKWLVANCEPVEKAAVVDRLSTEFPHDDTLFELHLRARFDKRDYSLPEEAFVRYALRQSSTMAFSLLWIERLLGLDDIRELAAYLTAHAEMLRGTDAGMNGAILLIDAIMACVTHGLEPTFAVTDVKTSDHRIHRAVEAWRSGDPFLNLRGQANAGVIPRYVRVHSFIHQGWGVPIARFQAQGVSDVVISALVERQPFSLIRLGDGEGNFLRWRTTTLINATMHRSAEHELSVPEISSELYQELHGELLGYLAEASVLGIPNEFMAEIAEDWASVNKALVDLPLQGVVTDHAIHYALAEYGCFERAIALQLIAKLPVIYIGPHDPATFQHLAVPTESIVHWSIPGEAYYFPETLQNEAHYPHYYRRIMDRIADLPARALVLISAGILGKFYTGAVKRRGGVALDIGAVSDHWAGHKTRIYAQQDGNVSADRMTLRQLLA